MAIFIQYIQFGAGPAYAAKLAQNWCNPSTQLLRHYVDTIAALRSTLLNFT